jgi:hypothetical protein
VGFVADEVTLGKVCTEYIGAGTTSPSVTGVPSRLHLILLIKESL